MADNKIPSKALRADELPEPTEEAFQLRICGELHVDDSPGVVHYSHEELQEFIKSGKSPW